MKDRGTYDRLSPQIELRFRENVCNSHSILFDHKTVRFACHATLPQNQGFGEELHAQHAVQEQANNQTGAEPVPLLGCRELTTTKIPKIVTKPRY